MDAGAADDLATDGTKSAADRASSSGVQSLHRALDIVEHLGQGGELGVSDLAGATNLPMPTIHRLLQTLTERGYVRRLPSRRYTLGFRFMPLASAAGATVGAGSESVLAQMVAEIGETANLAVLAGDRAQYVAQVESKHSVRMFTEVGRMVELHSSGVGKALLARLGPDQIARICRNGLTPRTIHTVNSPGDLAAQLHQFRIQGYAFDDQEHELAMRSVAVAGTGSMSWLAVAITGPRTRMTDELVDRCVPVLQDAIAQLTSDTSS